CAVIGCFVMTFAVALGQAGDDAKAALQGVWEAKSGEKDGKAMPAEALKFIRFTFKDDKLSIRGNFEDDSEATMTFSADGKKSPRQIDVNLPKDSGKLLGIYEINGDELKICLREVNKGGAGRPTEFSAK